MHLCEPCRSSRDWTNDTSVQNKIALNAQTREDLKARCATCQTFIRNPMFRTCEACAKAHAQCQHCSISTLTPEEQARRAADAAEAEEVDRVADLFTLLRKTYGISAARDLFYAHRDEIGPARVETVLGQDPDVLERGKRLERPIWTRVLGPNIFRFRFCQECASLPKQAPALLKAVFCGHFTTARSPAYCPLCAAEKTVCEGCGVSMVPGTEAGTEGTG